ncbi:thioredoxin-dependent thiol peroxidase [Candidatus Parcubacteria bacterium]|nr:thioredoxin-dependent thiol peroxidase [Candidatus Parcubacteria bacterium]
MKLAVGDTAPNFTLLDQDNKSHSLKEYRGAWLLLYFYPKDNTEGCTKEACALRDDFMGFKKLDVKIVGVSIDNPKSHKKFADDYKLPFTLLADDKKEVVNLYGVWGEKSMYGKKYMGTLRTSFLIDPEGKIEKIYEAVKPADHSREVLEDLKTLI